jgi:PAS domain S-box-containing protein
LLAGFRISVKRTFFNSRKTFILISMISSVKKFRPARNEFIYPFLIQTDSKGLITSVSDACIAFLSGYNITDYLYKNIVHIFSALSRQDIKSIPFFPEDNFVQTFDFFVECIEKKSVAIRWFCVPVLAENGHHNGWQFTGIKIPGILITETSKKKANNKIRSEKELHQYPEQIINILNSITDGFFMLDKNFTITLWNKEAEQLIGKASAKMIGYNILEKLPELFDANIYNVFLKACRKKTAVSIEQYIQRLGLWLEMNAYPSADGLFVYFKDVTQRKKQEMLLELEKNVLEINSNQKATLRITVDYFLEGIEKIFPGMLCSVLTLNEDGISMSHLSAPSLPKMFSLSIDGSSIGPGAGSCGTAMFTKKRVIVSDITKDPLWENYKTLAHQFNLRACWSLPIINAQGDILAAFATYYTYPKSPTDLELIIIDRVANLIKIIIENKRAEEKIKIINERYILATKATNDVIWDWDMKSAPFWSEGFYSQFGFKPGKKVNHGRFWESHIHPDDYAKVIHSFEKFISQKQKGIWLEEYRFKKANGKFALISDRGFLMYDEEGNIVRMIGSMQDITDRREMEKKLLKKELNKQKLIVQAVVDAQENERAQIGKELHDNVNQILSTTKLYLELARTDDDDRLNLITRSVKNIHHAINEIRNISRSLVPPSIGDLGLLDSINDLIENIKAIKAIHVEFYPVGAFEEKISDQQKLMLFRIIQEQVNNVLKHSEAKNLIIELILVENENRIELNITDDGKGFEPAKMKRKKGLGISNIISRADLFGGRVSIVSAKAEGCKLSIQVPIHNL